MITKLGLNESEVARPDETEAKTRHLSRPAPTPTTGRIKAPEPTPTTQTRKASERTAGTPSYKAPGGTPSTQRLHNPTKFR